MKLEVACGDETLKSLDDIHTSSDGFWKIVLRSGCNLLVRAACEARELLESV